MKTFTSLWVRCVTVLAAVLIGGLVSNSAHAAVAVSPIFSSNMVLQRGVPVPVFGTASPGESVTVSFQNQNQSTVANSSGKWQVNLNSMAASSSPSTMTITGSASSPVSLTGVQVGEVWLFSGQSNMDMRLDEAADSAAYIADAGNHNIRLFLMKSGNGPGTTSWQISNSTTAAAFSAVGYWTGLELSKKLGVPVGLIQATYDGSAIEEWMTISGTTGANYLSMVKPIQPYAIKGIGWYQGESNGGDSAYGSKLTSMINEWRSDWGLPNVPFGIVQLPSTKWSAARDGEFDVSQTVPNTFLVATLDLPGSNQLHPTTKKPIGLRMGIGARGLVYGENLTISGPVGDGPTTFVSGGNVVVKFNHLGNGLATSDGSAPTGFQVAAASGNFSSASATIVGDTVVLSSSISSPARVRYSFSTNGNLVNQVSIPVEGGAATVTSLPSPQFDLTISGSGGGTNPPAAPSGLAAAAVSSSQINLSWSDNSSDETGFEVDRATNSSFSTGLVTTNVGAGTTSFSATGLAASTTYYFRVRATNSAGDSANSNTASATTQSGGGSGSSMHVASIAVTITGGGNKSGVATVTIVDNNGQPVSGAVVTGDFTGTIAESGRTGTTNSSGVATIQTNGTARGAVSITFCVTNVSGSLTYNPGSNVVTCGSN